MQKKIDILDKDLLYDERVQFILYTDYGEGSRSMIQFFKYHGIPFEVRLFDREVMSSKVDFCEPPVVTVADSDGREFHYFSGADELVKDGIYLIASVMELVDIRDLKSLG